MNGQIKDVLLVEHLDDILALGYDDCQRQTLSLIQRITTGTLVGVGTNHSAEIRLIGYGQSIVLNAVNIVLHGVTVLIGRPPGVQIVGTVDVHAGGSAGSKCSAVTVSLSVPAGEGIAVTVGQTESAVIRNRDLLVVRHCFGGIFLISTEVAVIRDGHSGSLVAPDGVQIHVAGDLDGTIGIVRRAGAVRIGVPAQEDLAAIGEGVGIHRGKDVLGIDHLIVGNGFVGFGVAVVGHRVPAVIAYLGVQVIILVDLGVEVEGRSVLLHPAQEGFAFRQLEGGYAITADGAVLGNLAEGMENGTIHLIYRHRVGGSHPLGVQGNVLRGHLAGEDIGAAFAQFVVIPAGERIALFACGCSGGVVGIRNGLLKLPGNGLLRSTIVHKHDVIAVAGVIELGVVVASAVPGSFLVGEAGDGILILLGDGISGAGRGVVMVFLVGDTIVVRSGFAGQDFHIVVGCLGTLAGLGSVEACTAQRHRVDIGLIRVTILCCCPSIAAIVSGPLVADVSAVLGSDGPERDGCIAGAAVGVLFLGTDQHRLPIPPNITPPVVGMLFLAAAESRTVGVPEVDGVHIPLVVHIDNGAAVTGNSLLLNHLTSEAFVRLCSGRCPLAGGAGLGFGFLKGELIIVHILLPVDDGVIGLVFCRPLGVHSRVRLDGGEVSLCRQILVSVPTGKGVAGLGGSRRSRCGGAGGIKYRGHIAAAVGFEGDPIALLHLGIQRNVAVHDVHRRDLVAIGAIFVFIPAGDGFVGTHGKAHIFKGDRLAGRARLSGDDTAGVVL